MVYQTVELNIDRHIATVWLSRADRRNALNAELVNDLMDALDKLESNEKVRVVVLRGRGEYFCAGGDLKWMRSGDGLPLDAHPASCLARLFARLYHFPKPLITVVHGAALGGAMGLVATSDFVVAENIAIFSFTELKLGLIPAVISPFVIRRIGEFRARKLMLSARKIGAEEALRLELIDYICEAGLIDDHINGLCSELLQGAPLATMACKNLIVKVSDSPMNEDLYKYTAQQLRYIQGQEEAREGIDAFFNKRKPTWV